jgi:enamine deaminase RidA (YjgF/YER057c/UK114 family)
MSDHKLPVLESVAAPGAPEPFGHYSHATITPDGMIWASAQLPVNGGVTPASPVPAQARQALVQLRSVIEAAGGAIASVAKVTLYLTEISDWDSVDTVFGDMFGAHRPARTVIQVAGLHHGFRVAADAVAWRSRG